MAIDTLWRARANEALPDARKSYLLPQTATIVKWVTKANLGPGPYMAGWEWEVERSSIPQVELHVSEWFETWLNTRPVVPNPQPAQQALASRMIARELVEEVMSL